MTTIALSVPEQQGCFDYLTHFGDTRLSQQAQGVSTNFKRFAAQTLEDFVKFGRKFNRIKTHCLAKFGAKEGKRRLEDWLASDEFGFSHYAASTAMLLAEWYFKLPRRLKKLVVQGTADWSLEAWRELSKLPIEVLEGLIDTGRQAAKSVKEIFGSLKPKRYLTLGELATEADWLLVAKKYKLTEAQLDSLKLETHKIAQVNPSTGEIEVTTDDIVKALEACGYDPAKVMRKPKQKRYSNSEVEEIKRKTAEEAIAQYQASLAEQLEAERQRIREEIQVQLEAQYVEQLQLAEKEVLESENQRLRQQVQDLEKSLADSQKNPPDNSFSQSADQKDETLLAQKDAQIEELKTQIEAYKKLELPLTDQQLFVGASIKVICDPDGWAGETGTVTGKGSYGDWWVLLDEVKEQESNTLNLFKAGQLAFNVQFPLPTASGEEGQQEAPVPSWLSQRQQLKELKAFSGKNSRKREKPQGFGQTVTGLAQSKKSRIQKSKVIAHG